MNTYKLTMTCHDGQVDRWTRNSTQGVIEFWRFMSRTMLQQAGDAATLTIECVSLS